MDFTYALQIINLIIDYTWQLLNSNFFTALAGAGVGAFSAQFIVEKIKNRESLLKEIISTNTAIALCFEISNTFFNVKNQHIQGMFREYKKIKNEFIAIQSGLKTQTGTFHFETDFRLVSPPFVPIDKLLNIVFDDISLGALPIIVGSTLNRSLESCKDSLIKRNQLIEDYRSKHPIPQNILINLYFGLQNEEGHTDSSYPDTLESIYEQTDDCIYFSIFLMAKLIEHGKKLNKQYGREAPVINEPNFAKAIKEGLMPDEKNYESWRLMFPKVNK